MARGAKKGPNFEAKIAKIDEQIAACKTKLAALKEERAELLAHQEAAELVELNKALKAAGKSPSEMLELLK